ncbi:helix-turn-helix domain-containing protein [Cyanobacterium sp. Dongsha4]|nr:helix-turn-helix domain-containing protein [Cyanobacterium sp. Dongsha4]
MLAFGCLIKSKRNHLGISQEELGFRSGLDRTYISGIERGVRNPSFTALVKIAQGLNVTTSELLNGLENFLQIKENEEI